MQRMKEIGQRIRTAREKKGMKTSQLAEAVGIRSKIYMEDIERGLRIPPSEEVCQEIAKVLDIEFPSLAEYRAAAVADSRDRFENNKPATITQINNDFGTDLPADATIEMADAAILKVLKSK